MTAATPLADDPTVIQRVLDHIDNRTTDVTGECWREPVGNYRSLQRYAAEVGLIKSRFVGFCPSAALPTEGAFVAREAAGAPVVAVRGRDGVVRAFLNACAHRGAQVACDATGCVKAFVCPYHGWTYGLDGGLRGIPHHRGFPELDKAGSGLPPLHAMERGGVVFVAHEAPTAEVTAEIEQLPDPLIPERFRFVKVAELDVPVNWKIAVEGFLEGYHIRSTHPDTFYPIQFDNLNVIETFGRNNRVTFPYRNIESLRDTPPADRTADGYLTYAYHLFPNVIVATQPGRMSMIILEPTSVDSVRFVTYTMSDHYDGTPDAEGVLEREDSFAAKGARQDREVLSSIQRSLGANPRTHFEFGLFEGAIGHFHRELTALLDGDDLDRHDDA